MEEEIRSNKVVGRIFRQWFSVNSEVHANEDELGQIYSLVNDVLKEN